MITGIVGKIPTSIYSHNAAYTRIWADLLNTQISDNFPSSHEDLYITFDINYSGSLNLFGGAGESLYNRLNDFVNYQGKITMIEHAMPDLGKMLEGRLGNKTTFEKFNKSFLDSVSEKCNDISTITMNDLITDELMIGDSHSLSMAEKGVPVIRCDAKTLNSICSDHDYILSKIPDKVKKLTLHFGSIDIRHHLMRFGGTPAAIEILNKYYKLISVIQDKGIEVTICQPVPVEPSARKMAKTTMYKGKPFSGTEEERSALTKFVISHMKEHSNCNVIGYPEYWYIMDPKQFEKDIMERPRGIHVAYPNYRLNSFGKAQDTLEAFLN